MITLLMVFLPAFATPSVNLPADAVPEVVATPETEHTSGFLVVETFMPVEVIMDHVKLTQMWVPGTVKFEILTGMRALSLYVAGQPTNLPIEIQTDREVRVLVGRTGISVTTPEATPVDASTVEVELRVVGGGAVQVRLDGEKHRLSGGDKLALTLPSGPHAMSVRSADGTAIWAAGTLTLTGGAPVVVQIAEGRLPETSGPGKFEPSSGGGG
jgi:hypothetical protein